MAMPRRADRPDPEDSAAAAAYIADMTGSLAMIARRHGLDALGFILEMAREEALNNTRGTDGTRRQ